MPEEVSLRGFQAMHQCYLFRSAKRLMEWTGALLRSNYGQWQQLHHTASFILGNSHADLSVNEARAGLSTYRCRG